MKRFGLLILPFAFVACKKDSGPPPVIYGPTAAAEDPANLPAAGEAPPPVEVRGKLAAMWNTPLHTLQGKPTTLAANYFVVT